MDLDDAHVDGRTLRGQRNREALIDALMDVLRDGVLQPRAQDIAERAGLSSRSIFQHFADLDSLFVATSLRERARLEALIADQTRTVLVMPTLADRIAVMVDLRSRLWEGTLPYSTVMMLRASTAGGEIVTEAMSTLAEQFRRQLGEVFGAEIARLGGDQTTRLIALQGALGFELWSNLRFTQGLSSARANEVVTCLIEGLLRPEVTDPRPTPGH